MYERSLEWNPENEGGKNMLPFVTRTQFLLFTIFLAQCKGAADPSAQGQVSSPDTLITILPFQTGLMTPFTEIDLPVSLNASDLVLIDSLVWGGVNAYHAKMPNEKRASFGIDLHRTVYRRQYIAGVNSVGDTLVWVNCFCDKYIPANWRQELVLVRDGGNCYFNLTVNLTKRMVAKIFVNVHASAMPHPVGILTGGQPGPYGREGARDERRLETSSHPVGVTGG